MSKEKSGLKNEYYLAKYITTTLEETYAVMDNQNYNFNVIGENGIIEWLSSINGYLNILNICPEVQKEILDKLGYLFGKYKESYNYIEYNDASELNDIVINWEKQIINSLTYEFYRPNKIGEPTIFIGHGHNNAWEKLRDHLANKQKFKIETYETEERSGTIVSKNIEDMVAKSSIGFLFFTKENKDTNGKWHASDNVIHEFGICHNKFGLNRAIILLEGGEDGVVEPSNIRGIQKIIFKHKDSIAEIFGDVVSVIRREFS
jgi:predicted nucleotide-binding protein